MTGFKNWFETFLSEKEIDGDSKVFEFTNKSGEWNYMPVGVVFEYILNSSPEDQKKIKDILVKIDFMNGDVFHFFKYIAKDIGDDN